MPTHTEKWDLHESIPKLHLGTSALHVHTRTHTPAVSTRNTHAHTPGTEESYQKYKSSSYWSI